MKSILLLPLGILAIGLLNPSAISAQDTEESTWSGPQWEYLVLRIDDRRRPSPPDKNAPGGASMDKLNELGKRGWELVAVRNDGPIPVFYFKRKKG